MIKHRSWTSCPFQTAWSEIGCSLDALHNFSVNNFLFIAVLYGSIKAIIDAKLKCRRYYWALKLSSVPRSKESGCLEAANLMVQLLPPPNKRSRLAYVYLSQLSADKSCSKLSIKMKCLDYF